VVSAVADHARRCAKHLSEEERERVGEIFDRLDQISLLCCSLLGAGWRGIMAAMRALDLEYNESGTLLFVLAAPGGMSWGRFVTIISDDLYRNNGAA
jgi:hypothetical protein